MTLGSLFDGIGGFPLAAAQHGITPLWASEIEPAPVSITKHHFSGMKHLGDVTKINGAEIEPVDIITFGSPCQDLSVAGRRRGMGGAQSGLFFEAVRVIKEMREATNGKQPVGIIWENVTGAFSSNGGEDFRTVIEEIAAIGGKAAIPRPPSGDGWLSAGAVMGDGFSLAWRVLDAQYWGVPQRRRRIFLVADFGGERAAEILFKPESLRGDFTEGGKAGKGAAAGTENGAKIKLFENHGQDSRLTGPLDISPVVSAKWGTGGNNTPLAVIGIDSEMNSLADKIGTLRAHESGGMEQFVAAPNSFFPAVAHCLKANGNISHREDSDTIIVSNYSVRRLTPLECERLQGFPDGWTEYGYDGKRVSDSRRYKALGNSVAVPCVEFILSRIAEGI